MRGAAPDGDVPDPGRVQLRGAPLAAGGVAEASEGQAEVEEAQLRRETRAELLPALCSGAGRRGQRSAGCLLRVSGSKASLAPGLPLWQPLGPVLTASLGRPGTELRRTAAACSFQQTGQCRSREQSRAWAPGEAQGAGPGAHPA